MNTFKKGRSPIPSLLNFIVFIIEILWNERWNRF